MLRSAALNNPTRSRFPSNKLPDHPRVTPQRVCAAVQSSDLFPLPPSAQGKLGDKYAVIEVGGAQQIVEEGRNYTCHRLNVPAGSIVKLPRVLAVKEDGDFTLGDPYIESANVEAEIVEEYRAPKILVLRYRRKKHYRKVRGHRQEMTKFRVTKISKE